MIYVESIHPLTESKPNRQAPVFTSPLILLRQKKKRRRIIVARPHSGGKAKSSIQIRDEVIVHDDHRTFYCREMI